MKALARLPSAEGIAAMQSINITIINPLFLYFGGLSLFVALVLTGVGLLRNLRVPEINT
jgi:uncharacterized membrane protein